MRHSSSTSEASLLRLFAFVAMFGQGCSTHSGGSNDAAVDREGQLDVLVSKEVSPDISVAKDTIGGIVLPTTCSDVIAKQAVDRVTATLTCFSGRVSNSGCPASSRVCASFDFGYHSGDMFVFRPCDNDSQVRIDQLGQTATAVLQNVDASTCMLSVSISNSALDQLKETIVGCGGGYHVIVFDSNGSVVDVRDDVATGNGSQILNCILAESGDVSFPCLANLQICSGVPQGS